MAKLLSYPAKTFITLLLPTWPYPYHPLCISGLCYPPKAYPGPFWEGSAHSRPKNN